MTTPRQNQLLALLLKRGQTQVQDIAQELGASLATVRRDLTDLEAQGRVERLHGAAQIASAAREEVAFAARESVNARAKRTIAATAFGAVKPGATVFLDASTTVLQLVRHIIAMDQPIKVFTNSLRVAQELALVSHVDLSLIGGRVREENLSMVGPLACAALNNLWIDQLFLGATAIDNEGTLSSVDADEAAVNATMMARAAETFILADSSKFEKRATHAVTTLREGHRLITDLPPPPAFAAHAKRADISLTIANSADT
ncbi:MULTISPECIES: DeoR/GlpR family DNA-binding transcription regulator [Halocynthiibacter]|uniref:DeoR/GlpR family DNA-binding transcription regulator n=1 Tax=Halocynthiibacter halioticoli TaxID=2986804 RepID=A0AAE3J1F7_9RHOB|nr:MULTISPECIES: DeoR/GlpR family DNA-binding transcription regulator [Halocynthiibacter]MCV6824783.1 DeoR/GlpR family DNA-binding transcription regulator [Halocynthiibacter halioticoli]MCW4057784.1 DeoR/GlpR family DNA-binding transcription regulator [Halocynthiibacter sp. SDUM655004]